MAQPLLRGVIHFRDALFRAGADWISPSQAADPATVRAIGEDQNRRAIKWAHDQGLAVELDDGTILKPRATT